MGARSSRLGWGRWSEGIEVESRDGEVGQASEQDIAWQTSPVPTHTLLNLLSVHFLTSSAWLLATHPSSLASIPLTRLPPVPVCASVLAPRHRRNMDCLLLGLPLWQEHSNRQCTQKGPAQVELRHREKQPTFVCLSVQPPDWPPSLSLLAVCGMLDYQTESIFYSCPNLAHGET